MDLYLNRYLCFSIVICYMNVYINTHTQTQTHTHTLRHSDQLSNTL